ncbi:MAG: TfuA-like protein [Burkholderiaceae bacterium]
MPLINLYVGPTAYGLQAQLLAAPALRIFPPVRRGDIEALISSGARPAVIVICDGIFQSVPAVSHAELCLALDAQWKVWGVSSIGAIRAFELRNEGMHGFGHVYAMLCHDSDFADDEMCHLHFPETPYFPVSEPLVNLRHALASLGPKLGVSDRAVARTIEGLREMWFGDRTLEKMKEMMVVNAGVEPTKAAAILNWLVRNRVKTADLRKLLTQRPWQLPQKTA